jgi:hypothetical protein
MSDSINHPRFTRINKNQYVINNPDCRHRWYVHVGQVMNYLAFDKYLREGKNLADFPGIPLGYTDFAIAFNTGTPPHDKRQLSTCISTFSGDHITKSDNPVYLQDFHITQEQCGLVNPRRNRLTDAQILVNEQFAADQAFRNNRRTEHFQKREDKRNMLFDKPKPAGPAKNKSQRFTPYSTAKSTTHIDISDEDTSYGAFETPPRAKKPQKPRSRRAGPSQQSSSSSQQSFLPSQQPSSSQQQRETLLTPPVQLSAEDLVPTDATVKLPTGEPSTNHGTHQGNPNRMQE